MEINITAFVRDADPYEFSGSMAERGENAAKITWQNAMGEGFLLKTSADFDALRAHVKEFGAWSEEEIAAWSDQECNALFVQLISGDMREAGMEGEIEEFDWQAYEENDSVAHNIFKGDDGEIYYYLDT
jgi:hypothetical protein